MVLKSVSKGKFPSSVIPASPVSIFSVFFVLCLVGWDKTKTLKDVALDYDRHFSQFSDILWTEPPIEEPIRKIPDFFF